MPFLPIATRAITIPNIMGQAITSTQFYVYGKKYFTSTGYTKAVQSYTSPVQKSPSIKLGQTGADGVDLTDKIIVITGSNSGIGKEMATYAAAKNATVYMICRSKVRADAAREEIVKLTQNDRVEVLLADVGELHQIKSLVKEIESKTDKIHCLICNAGVLLNDRQETSEGNEVTFASHLLGGSYLLSSLLVPLLKNAGDEARVVFTSSGGMYNSKFPNWDKVTSCGKYKDKYDGNFAYTFAKRGQVLLAQRWSRDIPEICWVSAHPGWTDTPAVELAYGSSKSYLEPMRSPWEGAEGICWLMSTPRTNLENGEFYLDRCKQRKHISGAFMTSGSYTRNTEEEIDSMTEHMKKACSDFVQDKN